MSETKKEDNRTVHERWLDVMDDLRELAKGDRNDFHKFMFRGIDSVMNAVGPKLRKHGVMVIPSSMELRTDTAPSSGGKLTQIVRVLMQYTVIGKNGDSFTGSAWGEANDTADKATAKAESVAYRTFLLQALTLPTHDTDPDAEGEVLRQKPGWQQEVDKQPTAEAVESLIYQWKQQREVPESVLTYARARIAQLRKK